MEQRHRDVIRDNWVFLMDNLSLDYVLPILFQNRLLSEDLIDQIKSEATSKRKNYAFLTILQRRGSKAFPAFLQALAESDQDHVYQRLRPMRTEARSTGMQEQTRTPPRLAGTQEQLRAQTYPAGVQPRSPPVAAEAPLLWQPLPAAATTRTSQGNVLQHPEASAATAATTLEEEFYRRLAIREGEGGIGESQAKTFNQRQPSKASPPPNNSVQAPSSPPPPTSAYSPHRRSSVEHSVRSFRSPFDIAVKKTESLPLDFSVRLGNGEIYPNFSKPKGLCLIINNREFEKTASDLTFRQGSDRDAVNLSCLFEQMGYAVEMRRDLDSESFEEALESFSADDRHSASDSAVVCVLSHGQERGVYAADGIVIHFSQILDALDGPQCPQLVNKPKLFFFQACRGVRVQRGFDVVDRPAATTKVTSSSAPTSAVNTPVEEEAEDLSSSSSSSSIAKRETFYRIDSNGDVAVPRGESDDDDDDVDGILKATSLAKYSDMLVSYSTIPGHISIRHEEMGSWYVQAIVDVFSEFAADRDIHSLLTKVNRKVSKMTTGGQMRKQMPEPRNHLTRDFYFFPGHFLEDQNQVIRSLFDIGASQPLEIA